MEDSLEELKMSSKRLSIGQRRLAAEIGHRKQADGQLPHDSQIESDAHAVAQQLGQAIQTTRSEQVRKESEPGAACPDCGGPMPRGRGAANDNFARRAYRDHRSGCFLPVLSPVFFSLSVKHSAWSSVRTPPPRWP